MNKKICCVITNRASYTKFKSLLKYLKKDSKINVQIVVASGVILEKYGKIFRGLFMKNTKAELHICCCLANPA